LCRVIAKTFSGDQAPSGLMVSEYADEEEQNQLKYMVKNAATLDQKQ